ncbi:MAG TPA: hypothetical protein VKT52_00970, partial [Ktedonobacterales bacterium]|nr:hypothetical protein [Ktedonobacterales bacterium]
MMRAEAIELALREARGWRDMLWADILEELDNRDPAAAAAVRSAIRSEKTSALRGRSTRDAALAWQHLDYQARMDWLWVCQF